MKVICNNKDNELCRHTCLHFHPHAPLMDCYNIEIGPEYCHQATSECGFRGDNPDCICVEVEDD